MQRPKYVPFRRELGSRLGRSVEVVKGGARGPASDVCVCRIIGWVVSVTMIGHMAGKKGRREWGDMVGDLGNGDS